MRINFNKTDPRLTDNTIKLLNVVKRYIQYNHN